MQSVNSCKLLLMMIGIVVVFGAIGGITGRWFRSVTENGEAKQQKLKFSDFALWAFCGIWSAGGVVMIGTAIATFFDRQNSFLQWFVLIFVSGIGGFFADRWLPSIASKFEKELDLVRDEVSQIKEESNREISEIKQSSQVVFGYTQALNSAFGALRSQSRLELNEAAERMRPILEKFPDDRMLNITFARLLRWQGQETDAIIFLRKYVSVLYANAEAEHRDLNGHERVAVAVAQYNIACYHAILLKKKPKDEESRLLEEIRVALKEAIKFNGAFIEAYKDDPDFKEVLEQHPGFIQ